MDSQDGVERPGPGQAPSAFRIWQAGENICKWLGSEPETFYFTPRSAELLAKSQAERGMLYAFDLDHRSLKPQTNQDGEAAGWHRLEFRPDANGNPECWAVACEWAPEIKAGIEAKPPRWRYFSPVWDVDPETNEIVSYTCCAVTNGPATLNIPSLAASKGKTFSKQGVRRMDKKAALAALQALTDEPLTDKQKEAVAALARAVDAATDADEPEDKDEKSASEDPEDKDEPKEEGAKASETEDEPKDEDEEPKAAKAGTSKLDFAALLDEVRKENILDKAGISGQRRASLMREPLSVVEKVVEYSPQYAARNARPARVEKSGAVDDGDPVIAMIRAATGSAKKDKVQ